MSGPDTDVKLAIDNANEAWDLLAEKVDSLLAAWDRGEEPALGEFLPIGPPPLRHLILVELIKVDLERRWLERHSPKLVEDYVSAFPELAPNGQIPADLIYEEFHIRKQSGDAVDQFQYFERFPQQATELGRLLGYEASAESTILSSRERLSELNVGETIDDFDLLLALGKGAFATVYLARQKSMQRLVALKISSDKGAEPQTLAQLDHPHIVRVFDQRHLAERHLRLLYMQYVAGGTLQSVLAYLKKIGDARSGQAFVAAIDHALVERGESPPSGSMVRQKLQHATWPQVVAWLGARLASALAYAHEQGVLHRDIKPANVLVAADGTPRLADFNVSCASKISGSSPAAYFGGSLAYMSPEQLQACNPSHERKPEDLDGRSDVYSLGIMLWELLTGSRPFADDAVKGPWSATLEKLTESRRLGVGAATRARIPTDAPAGLEEVLLRCLAFDVSERFANAADAAHALDLCLQPRAQRLLGVPRGAWRRRLRKWPTIALLLIGLAPNVILSALNIAYNFASYIRLQDADFRRVFFREQLFGVNSVFYAVGLAAFFLFALPVARAVARLAMGTSIDKAELPMLRARCLKLGLVGAVATAALWGASGFVFPKWFEFRLGEARITGDAYVHFLTAQTVCGLIAAALTFFAVTFVAVHLQLPRLIQVEPPNSDEALQLARVRRWMAIAFSLTTVAVIVPFISLALLQRENRLMPLWMFPVSVSALFTAMWLRKAVDDDLGALSIVIDPAGGALAGEESESFWSGTRR